MHRYQKYKKIAASIVVLASFLPNLSLAADTTTTTTVPAGTQFTDASGAVWLVTDQGCRQAYTSLGAFKSFSFNNLASVQKATADDLAVPICDSKFILPREGMVMFSTNQQDFGTGYLITNGQKRGFTSEQIFKSLGFQGKPSQRGDVSFIPTGAPITSTSDAHADGTLINDHGTYKIVNSNGNIGVPDPSTLKSWGYNFNDAVPANNSDRQMGDGSTLPQRGQGQLGGRDLVNRCLMILMENKAESNQTNSNPGTVITQTTGDNNSQNPIGQNQQPQTQGQQPNNMGMGQGMQIRPPKNCPPPPPCLHVNSTNAQSQGQSQPQTQEQTQEHNATTKPEDQKPHCRPMPCIYSGTNTSTNGQTTNGTTNSTMPQPNNCPPIPCPLMNGQQPNGSNPSNPSSSGQTGTLLPNTCQPPCPINQTGNTPNPQGTQATNQTIPCQIPKCPPQGQTQNNSSINCPVIPNSTTQK